MCLICRPYGMLVPRPGLWLNLLYNSTSTNVFSILMTNDIEHFCISLLDISISLVKYSVFAHLKKCVTGPCAVA